MKWYINKVTFFYKPYNLGQLYKLTIIAIFIFYVFINVRVAVNLKRNREAFRSVVKECLFHKLSEFKVRGIVILTLLFGVSFVSGHRK